MSLIPLAKLFHLHTILFSSRGFCIKLNYFHVTIKMNINSVHFASNLKKNYLTKLGAASYKTQLQCNSSIMRDIGTFMLIGTKEELQ